MKTKAPLFFICGYPDCFELGLHPHHITYQPNVEEKFCVKHHKEIETLLFHHSDRDRITLSNDQRIRIYKDWISGAEKVTEHMRAVFNKFSDWKD